MGRRIDKTLVYTIDNRTDGWKLSVCQNEATAIKKYMEPHWDPLLVLEDVEMSLKRGFSLFRELCEKYTKLAQEQGKDIDDPKRWGYKKYKRLRMVTDPKALRLMVELESAFVHLVTTLGALEDRMCNLAIDLHSRSGGTIWSGMPLNATRGSTVSKRKETRAFLRSQYGKYTRFLDKATAIRNDVIHEKYFYLHLESEGPRLFFSENRHFDKLSVRDGSILDYSQLKRICETIGNQYLRWFVCTCVRQLP